MKKTLSTLLFILSFIVITSTTFAQSPEITNGLNYLTSTQNPDGSWGGTDASINTDFYSTAVSAETLNILNETNTQAFINSVQWLSDYTAADNGGYIAWRILALSEENIDLSADLNLLLQWQNNDGGWGGYLDYNNSIFHTALTLQALYAIGYSDLSAISFTLNYLTGSQNTDGGFGFYPSTPSTGSGSTVYMTALVLKVLSLYNDTFDLQTEIDNAVAYLLSQQNVDGAISSDTSTVYETALALDALIASDSDVSTVAQPAIDYLLTNQLSNGSWNDDPYSTALALRALASVKPNLTIAASDITFSNSTPTVGDIITITAVIHNTGIADSENVLVQFYDGDPDAGGVLIEETTILLIPVNSDYTSNIEWTIPVSAAYRIFIRVDPLNVIEELDETDNSAYKNLTSATLPDLSITSSDIVFNPSPALPGEVVTITSTVRNNGETDARDITVDFYNGNPESGGVIMSYMVIPSIDPGSAIAIQLQESFNEGNHAIYVVVDGTDIVEETNDTNNTAMKILQVGTSIVENIDLLITPEDITFSPAYPTDGDMLTIRTAINNIGNTEAANVMVRFYLGNPDSGGIQIGSDINISLISARSTVTVETTWDSTGYAGNNDIYVLVDPDDTIAEDNENNNEAFRTLKVAAGQGPDLTLLSSDITFSPSPPLMGDPLTITANISNIGVEDASNVLIEFSLGDPNVGGTLIIGNETIPFIAQGDIVSVQTIWNTTGFSGSYEIYVNVDPFNEVVEMNETNNTAYVPITITAPQGPDLTISVIDTTNLLTDTQTIQISGSIDITLENIGNQDTVSALTITAFEDLNENEILDAGIDNILGNIDYLNNLASQVTDNITMALTGNILFRDNLIYVFADSSNVIEELDETNNLRNMGQECEYIPPVGTFNPVEKWAWTGSNVLPTYNQVISTPVVANMTDDNSDGIINEKDIPDVLFITAEPGDYTGGYYPGVLRVISGDDGGEIFTITNPDYRLNWTSTLAVGDIDGDGMVEIIGSKSDEGTIAFEHDGTLKWVSQYGNAFWGGISVADLDTDGDPEIIIGATVLNNDGTLRWIGTGGRGRNWFENLGGIPLVADIDLDGVPEVVAGNTVYKNDGTILWMNTFYIYDGFNAVANFDDDPYAEIVLVSKGWVYLFEHDGIIKWGPVPVQGGGRGGAPTIADFDGDGEPEIGVAGYARYVVFDTDGSILWQSITQDYSSNVTGSSVFDFDGDGQAEVVYNDEKYLRIYRGSNGQVLFSTPNSSATAVEYPIIVDVDNDNRAEIIVSANDYYPPTLIDGKGFHGIRVFEDSNDNWVNTRKIWNQHTYHITNINDDGTIPQVEQNNWETYNNYRLNALLPEEVLNSSDITVSFITVDLTNFPTSVVVSARIGNGGAVSHPAGVDIAFYDGDPSQGGVLIGTTNTTATIEKGDYEDVSVVWNSPVSGEHDIYVVADESNIFNECREDNNTASASFNLEEGIQPPPIEDFPDLEVSSSDITIIPPDTIEGQPAVIAALIHNIGTLGASDTVISFYDGDPQSGGTLIGSVTESLIDAGSDASIEITWNTLGQTGINYIHVVADPENLIAESNENNNASLIQVEVFPPLKPDLTVTSDDIAFSHQSPKEGDPLIITSTIYNLGTDAGNIKVNLYDGIPESGGILLNAYTITQIIPFSGQTQVTFNIDTVGSSGNHSFYIVVDPDNTIDEQNEDNNRTSADLLINSIGLALTETTNKTQYTENEDVLITVNVTDLQNELRELQVGVEIFDSGGSITATLPAQSATLNPLETKALSFIWNTGTTLFGAYSVTATTYDTVSQPLARQSVPISIVSSEGILTNLVMDKVEYYPNELVTITSSVSNLSINKLYQNFTATVTIKDFTGQVLSTEVNAIGLLTPSSYYSFNTYWNTSQNPEGTYTVNIEVLDGATVLDISTAAFEILGTGETGEGLTGTITASPDPVYQGEDETITYTITNNGNKDITNLNVTVLIVDPDTQEIKNTFKATLDLPMNTIITGNFISSTSDLTPKVYLVILQVSSALITEPKSLDSTTFEVEASLEITKTIPDTTNLLVWVNNECEDGDDEEEGDDDHDDSEEECIRLDLLEDILKQSSSSYYIVYDKKDFQKELRSPYYTDFLILGKHHSLEDHFWEEVREQVYSGKGIVSSLWIKHGEHDNDFFGVKHKGHLSGDKHEVELLDSPITAAGTLNALGKAVKLEADEDTTIAGLITADMDDDDNSDGDDDDEEDDDDNDNSGMEYPAIVLNNYGRGRTIYYAFDLGLTLNDENYNQLSELINNSISYVHNSADTTPIYPNYLIPVEIKIKSLGGAFDIRITETYPAEIKLYNPSTDQWITENPWVIDILLEPDETKTILYYALAPDSAGTYTLQTEVGYLEGGTYNLYQELNLDIAVDKNTNDMAGDVINVLNALTLSGSEKSKRDNAVKDINNVLNRTIDSEKDVEKNIKDIRKAIDSLLHITSVDVSDIRLIMDELLKTWESRYYLFKSSPTSQVGLGFRWALTGFTLKAVTPPLHQSKITSCHSQA